MAIPGQGPEGGKDWLGSLRAAVASLVALLRTRAELFSLELSEEKERHKQLLMLAAVAALFLFLALQLLAVLVIVAFWDTYRLAAAAGVTALYLAVGLGALLALRRRWRATPPPFSATLNELRKDLEALGRRNE